jgi:hypothetical protein
LNEARARLSFHALATAAVDAADIVEAVLSDYGLITRSVPSLFINLSLLSPPSASTWM